MRISKTSKKRLSVYQLTLASILTAMGIVIPIISPIKMVIEPASFTLASHVPIFLAMFISPGVTAMVCIGTSIGFLLGGFPISVVLRASSHIIFALLGAIWLQKYPNTLKSFTSMQIFSFLLAIIHALCEIMVIGFFYLGNQITNISNQSTLTSSIFISIGVIGVIHSIIDFNIAFFIYKALSKNRQFKKIFIQP